MLERWICQTCEALLTFSSRTPQIICLLIHIYMHSSAHTAQVEQQVIILFLSPRSKCGFKTEEWSGNVLKVGKQCPHTNMTQKTWTLPPPPALSSPCSHGRGDGESHRLECGCNCLESATQWAHPACKSCSPHSLKGAWCLRLQRQLKSTGGKKAKGQRDFDFCLSNSLTTTDVSTEKNNKHWIQNRSNVVETLKHSENIDC